MLPTPHCLLSKLRVGINARAHNHQLDVLVREEVVRGAIVLRVRVVDSTVLSLLDTRLVFGRLSTLQESIHLKVWVGKDEGHMEGLGGEAIAHEANLDWSHCGISGVSGDFAGVCGGKFGGAEIIMGQLGWRYIPLLSIDRGVTMLRGHHLLSSCC